MNRPRGRSNGRVNLLYGLGTAIYFVIIYWLSSVPDFAIREQHPVIRLLSNLAHAPAFAGLAYCVLKTMPRTDDTSWGPYIMAFGITAFLALLDEYHQSFVPGRSASAGDWLLDVAGIVSVLVILRVRTISMRQRCEAQ